MNTATKFVFNLSINRFYTIIFISCNILFDNIVNRYWQTLQLKHSNNQNSHTQSHVPVINNIHDFGI